MDDNNLRNHFLNVGLEFGEVERHQDRLYLQSRQKITKAWTRQVLFVAKSYSRLIFCLLISIPVLNFSGHQLREEICKMEESSTFKTRKILFLIIKLGTNSLFLIISLSFRKLKNSLK